ncbi:MAG: virulence protein RhuM/Fic/DOC family protein [Raineya sp.]|nr:virulence protein RhuM/Fic/DOC family protein [Raineya sp.]MDW8297128.1 virulence protein RhuM/Fic/DOC family protein [Raineya sp.]
MFQNEIIIYQTPDKQSQVEVKFEGETFWLSQKQMAELFDKDTDTIGLHLKNIYAEGELSERATTEFFSVVQNEGKRQVKRKIKFYNLDAIISVGYRVNSKRGTQFRQWATQRLKEFLIQGYTINQKRLQELGKIIQIIEQTQQEKELQLSEAKGLLEVLSSYAKSFILLNQYDSRNLPLQTNLNKNITYEITYEEAKKAILELKKELIAKGEATELFGKEKDDSFKSSLQSIVQTFGGEYLYPSVEEQAAHLLYFVIKNHSFIDGNKRIGAFLFIWFLEKNKHRFKKNGEVKINDNGLTALALLIAQSHPDEKDLMIALTINLING